MELTDTDIFNFDFLYQPSYESLEDALKQLYLIDAIDEDGLITKIGRQMAELPLEPSLERALIAANDDGLYPEYVLYNELLVTSRPYIRN